MERAYSILNTKEYEEDDEKVYISGIASTPTPDRMGDIVEPKGAIFATPMPLLWQHRHAEPVGLVTFAKPGRDGIPFKAELPKIKEEGNLKERVNEAIHSLKYKLVSAVSIGFNPIEYSHLDDYAIRFLKWEWLELSLVTIPANAEAVLDAVKSVDYKALSALGRKASDRDFLKNKPGVTGKSAIRRPVQLITRR